MKHVAAVTRFGILGLVFAGLLVGSLLLRQSVNAGHNGNDVTLPTNYNRKNCSGTHCTFIASWMDRDSDGVAIIEAILNMNVFALEFGIQNSVGQVTTTIRPGDSFTIPIDATGEIVGHAGRFEDSPPITFRTGGVVQAETTGLEQCGFAQGSIAEAGKGNCGFLTLTANEDIFGTWSDVWTASQSGVTCQSNAAGTVANCTSTATASGPITLTLTRTVDNFIWHNQDKGKQRNIPVIAESDQLKLLVKNANIQDPFPGSMKSTVTVFLGTATPTPVPTSTTVPTATPSGTPECSDGADNDSDGRIDCNDYGCLSDVEDPNSCVPTDDDETDIPGFDPGPFQEQD